MTTTRRALLGFFAGLPLAWKALSVEGLEPEEGEKVVMVESWERLTYGYRTRTMFFKSTINPDLFCPGMLDVRFLTLD